MSSLVCLPKAASINLLHFIVRPRAQTSRQRIASKTISKQKKKSSSVFSSAGLAGTLGTKQSTKHACDLTSSYSSQPAAIHLVQAHFTCTSCRRFFFSLPFFKVRLLLACFSTPERSCRFDHTANLVFFFRKN